MPISPSSSVQRAREQLAERLRDIRLDAHLTARALSAAAGWHEAKTSRIESAKKAPSEDDIRTWCRVCGAERAVPDLIAASRSADSMYVEWRRLQPAGMRRDQENRLPLHERTKVLKAYVGTVVPGFLQTPEYATALLSAIRGFHGTPDDVADAVAVRMQRKRLVQSGSHRYIAILEEAVLRQVIGDAEVMAGQLSYLLEATPLPALSLGVIPCPGSPSTAMRHGRESRRPSTLSNSSASSRKFLPCPGAGRAASNYAPARLRIAGWGG